ncbi:MAG: DUF721 domain-containing protein [Eggerthellaceae bacterium]
MKLSAIFDESIARIPGADLAQLRKARKVESVRRMWRGLVSQMFLDHTNSVFVFDKDGRREMHVYVDDSIFAAELNAQREIIKWRCLEEYGEPIDEFFIHVSRGHYKDQHPFAGPAQSDGAPSPCEALTPEEEAKVEQAASAIPDMRLREAFREAMISDMRWKKSEKR